MPGILCPFAYAAAAAFKTKAIQNAEVNKIWLAPNR